MASTEIKTEEIKTEEIEKAVSVIIKKTFAKLVDIYRSHKERNDEEIISGEKSRLIFPCYADHCKCKNEVRVSEQELRFAFVESFYEYCGGENHLELFYSIETPTQKKYRFKEKDNPHECEKKDDDYDSAQSASFDLVLYDNTMTRRAYFEFKANNAVKEEHQKDLCKLIRDSDDDSLCYFIEIVKSHNDKTIESLKQKLSVENNMKKKIICIVCDISEEKEEENVIVWKEYIKR